MDLPVSLASVKVSIWLPTVQKCQKAADAGRVWERQGWTGSCSALHVILSESAGVMSSLSEVTFTAAGWRQPICRFAASALSSWHGGGLPAILHQPEGVILTVLPSLLAALGNMGNLMVSCLTTSELVEYWLQVVTCIEKVSQDVCRKM